MKIKVKRDMLVGQENVKAGETIEVNERRGQTMVEAGDAERAEQINVVPIDSPPDVASRATLELRTGRPTRVPVAELTGELNPPDAINPDETRESPVEGPRRVVLVDSPTRTAEVKDDAPAADARVAAAKEVADAKADPKPKK